MNQTHVHLLVTHLPIVGSLLGAVVLAYALWSKSNQTKIAAYLLFILSSIGAGIGYLTGEAAEETVENIVGVSEKMVEQHEDFALFALISLIVLGVVSVAAVYVTARKLRYTGATALVVFFLSIVSFVLVARTGYLGGQIRHTEIHSNPVWNAEPENVEHD